MIPGKRTANDAQLPAMQVKRICYWEANSDTEEESNLPFTIEVGNIKRKSPPPTCEEFHGVVKVQKRWRVQFWYLERLLTFRSFDSVLAAAKSYDKLVREHALMLPLNFDFEVKEERVQTEIAETNSSLVEMGKKLKIAHDTKLNLEVQLKETKTTNWNSESAVETKNWYRGREEPLERLQELKDDNDKLREAFGKAREIKRGLAEENNVHISNLIQATHELKEIEQEIANWKQNNNIEEEDDEKNVSEEVQKKEDIKAQIQQSKTNAEKFRKQLQMPREKAHHLAKQLDLMRPRVSQLEASLEALRKEVDNQDIELGLLREKAGEKASALADQLRRKDNLKTELTKIDCLRRKDEESETNLQNHLKGLHVCIQQKRDELEGYADERDRDRMTKKVQKVSSKIKEQEQKSNDLLQEEKELLSKSNMLALLSDKLLMAEESSKTRRYTHLVQKPPESESKYEVGDKLVVLFNGRWNKLVINEKISSSTFKVNLDGQVQVLDLTKSECCENAWLK